MAIKKETVSVGKGMDLRSRLLWYLAWHPRPLFIVGGVLAVLGAVWLHSTWGLLLGGLAFVARWKATKLANVESERITDLAKAVVAKTGAQRVGVDLAQADCRLIVIAQDEEPPFGLRAQPRYSIAASMYAMPSSRCTRDFVGPSGSPTPLGDDW